MTIQSKLSQDIDPTQRWEITELGREALRDSVPTMNAEPTKFCDGGHSGCKEQSPAYIHGHGYGDGQVKAHSELRYRTADHDPQVCRCECCITVRTVLARFGLWPQGLAATGDADHPDYPGYKVCRGCSGPHDGHFPACVVQLYEKRRESTPEEAQRVRQWFAENAPVNAPAGCPENPNAA